MDVWPFLMAASDYSDYRLVLCPDVLASADRRDLIRNNIDPASDGGAETVRHVDVHDDKLGSLSLYYNVIRLKRDGADAYDPSGRPLLRIQGLVARGGRLAPDEAARLMAASAAEIDRAFEAFWAGKERPPVSVSSALGARVKPGPGEDPTIPPPPEERIASRRSPANKVLIAAFAASLLLNVVLAWKGFPRGPDNTLTAAQLGKAKAALEKANKEIARLKKKAGEAGGK